MQQGGGGVDFSIRVLNAVGNPIFVGHFSGVLRRQLL